MLRHVQHGRPGQEGATPGRVRWNEAITHVAFGGRRRRVYARIAAPAAPSPGTWSWISAAAVATSPACWPPLSPLAAG
jgi:hypothetical protein